MADPQTIITARIQNRRGLRQHLPQPLLPGELGLAIDTGQLFIGADPLDPASITAPIIEIYNDYVVDSITNNAISNSYVAVANQILGTIPTQLTTAFVLSSSGTGAEISVVVNDNGSIDTVDVDTGGTGYQSSNTTIEVEHPYGSGFSASITIAAGVIQSIEVEDSGTDYQAVTYGYVTRVKMEEYSYIDINGDSQTSVTTLATNVDPDPSNLSVMFIPEYDRIDEDYAGHQWVFIAYKLPFGNTAPTFTFEYAPDQQNAPDTLADILLKTNSIPFPQDGGPENNQPYYSFVGPTLDLSIAYQDDQPYNSADAAAAAQAINWSFNNGVSGFEYINNDVITDLGITGATGRGTGIVTVVQNIEIHTDRGNDYNVKIATLVRNLRATTLSDEDNFNTRLVYRPPNPTVIVSDGVITEIEFASSSTQGLGYISDPVITINSDTGTLGKLSATARNNSVTSVDIDNGGRDYPSGSWSTDDSEPFYLSFSQPDGLRSTGIWFDVNESDSFSIKYSIKNSTDLRKGDLSLAVLGNDYIINDNYDEITNGSTPLGLVFVPVIDIINNVVEIKYSASTLPDEDINPTSLSTNTLRWKNF